MPKNWWKINVTSVFEKGKTGGSKELVSQLHLTPLEDNGAAKHGNHLQAHQEQENHHKLSGGLHQREVMLNQPDKFYSAVTGLVHDRRGVGVVSLEFCKVCDTVFRKIHAEKGSFEEREG